MVKIELCGDVRRYVRNRDAVIGVAIFVQRLQQSCNIDDCRISRVSCTREVEGSGLGLAMVKYIVEAHNGTVSVESKVGEGSTFTVNLPIKA